MPETADAQDALILAYRPLVAAVVRRLRLPRMATLDDDDLVSLGTVGLVEAARRYDPTRGSFAAFATPRIRGAILDAVREASGTPPYRRSNRPGTVPAQTSLHSPVPHQDDELALIDIVADPHAAGAFDEAEWRVLAAHERLLASLTPRERTVLDRLYRDGCRAVQVARALGVSESRIAQIHARALARLRAASDTTGVLVL